METATDTVPEGGLRRLLSPWVIALVLLSLLMLRPLFTSWFDGPVIQTWSTLFVSTMLQATPFLVLGVAFSAAIAAFVPTEKLSSLLPENRVAAVATAGGAGFLLPGCECGSVPISGRLVSGGALPAAALAFMLSAPAINPVVLVSTSVAFPGRPEMVLARFLASLATAVVMGLIALKLDTRGMVEHAMRRKPSGSSKWMVFATTARHDFLQAGGYLVLGAAIAAAIQVFLPRAWLSELGGMEYLAIIAMAGLAIILSICSEADAFVAASFIQVSPTAQLSFMVVGPAVDIKLASMQVGVFGAGFARRFAPLTAVIAVVSAIVVGGWLL